MNTLIKMTVISSAVLCSSSLVQAQTVAGALGAPLVSAGNLVTGVAVTYRNQRGTLADLIPVGRHLVDVPTKTLGALGDEVSDTGKTLQKEGILLARPATGSAPLVSVGARKVGDQGSVVSLNSSVK